MISKKLLEASLLEYVTCLRLGQFMAGMHDMNVEFPNFPCGVKRPDNYNEVLREARYLHRVYPIVTMSWMDELSQYIQPEPGHRVLEICAGTGYMAKYLSTLTNKQWIATDSMENPPIDPKDFHYPVGEMCMAEAVTETKSIAAVFASFPPWNKDTGLALSNLKRGTRVILVGPLWKYDFYDRNIKEEARIDIPQWHGEGDVFCSVGRWY